MSSSTSMVMRRPIRGLSVFVGLCAAALVWQRIYSIQLGYRVEDARKSIESLESRIAVLDQNLEAASSPERLAETAKARLGMIPAPLESLEFMDEDQTKAPSGPQFSAALWKKLRAWRTAVFPLKKLQAAPEAGRSS